MRSFSLFLYLSFSKVLHFQQEKRHQLLRGTPVVGNKTYYNRTSPLGVDRYGCQYWMFGAQANFPVTSFLNTPYSVENTPMPPQFVVRSPEGVWKLYTCNDINTFVARFSSEIIYEKELRNAIIDRCILLLLRNFFLSFFLFLMYTVLLYTDISI